MSRVHAERELGAVKDSLARLEAESWGLYLAELSRLDVVVEEIAADDWDTPLGQYLRSDAGHPLGLVTDSTGAPYPSGTPLWGGAGAGAHIGRWMAMLRADPCSYCEKRDGGTVDHVTPQVVRERDTHTWANMAGSCPNCNAGKGAMSMVEYLWRRSSASDRRRRRDRAYAELARAEAA